MDSGVRVVMRVRTTRAGKELKRWQRYSPSNLCIYFEWEGCDLYSSTFFATHFPTPIYQPNSESFPLKADDGFRLYEKMEVYYEGQRGTPPAVDIVFVHGLKGDVNETWTTDGVCWPRDLLKEDVPKARIMSWAWDSSIAGATKYSSQTTLFQNAETLLADLQFSRASDEEVSRY